MNKLVLASNNVKKVGELQALLTPLGITVITQGELGIPEAEEPHITFVENALAKARHAAKISGLPALADDSGLCVDVLGGAPGVFSARYAGDPKSDTRNNDKLLTDLAPFPALVQRRAHYACVLVLVNAADDPQPLITEGNCRGEILTVPQGEGGFGYDPLFWLPEFELSMAELAPDLKNRISHRGRAMARLVERLATRY